MTTQSPTLFVLYEPGQEEALTRWFVAHPDDRATAQVIALGLDVEMKLQGKRIPFFSGRRYKKIDPRFLTTEDAMVEGFFANPRWKQFEYRNINLTNVFLFTFRAYLQRVGYYSNLIIAILRTHPDATRLMLFAPQQGFVPDVSGALAPQEINVVIDCARQIAKSRGIEVTILPISLAQPSKWPSLFMVKRAFFGVALRVWNAGMALIRQPSHPRLLITDYWRHVGSVVDKLPGGECVFLDRLEIQNIPLKTLFTYRMRFMHVEDFLSRKGRRRAHHAARRFAETWTHVRPTVRVGCTYQGSAVEELLLQAMDAIVKNSERVLLQIEGTYALYERVRPDIVLLRASVSGQTHFSVLPLVAKQCGIPSVELQHGLEYLGTGSLSREHLAEYLAVYGPLVKKELCMLGYAPEKVREIGSPRFDVYYEVKSAGTQERFTVLCIAPDIRPFEIYDSYSAEEYFSAVATATETIPNVHVIIKLRTGPAGEASLRAAIANSFSRVPHTIAQSESLAGLLARSDAVVSCYSTAVLEALQYNLPVVIPALNPIDAEVVRFHFSPYRDAGALDIAFTHGELSGFLADIASDFALRRDRQAKIWAFLADNFRFDGNSSSRFAALITELARSGK